MWGTNPSGQLDQTLVLGDVDGDNVLDRMPLNSLAAASITFTSNLPSPHVAWQISLFDGEMRYELIPVGNGRAQLVLSLLLALTPFLTSALAVSLSRCRFSTIKVNRNGVSEKRKSSPAAATSSKSPARMGDFMTHLLK